MEPCVYILHLEQLSIQTILISSSLWPSMVGVCSIAQPSFGGVWGAGEGAKKDQGVIGAFSEVK